MTTGAIPLIMFSRIQNLHFSQTLEGLSVENGVFSRIQNLHFSQTANGGNNNEALFSRIQNLHFSQTHALSL
mgnify:CR=1 FL=1